MSVSVTMAFKGTVLYAMVRAQILPGQINPKGSSSVQTKARQQYDAPANKNEWMNTYVNVSKSSSRPQVAY